jgi:hypothetical protein|tara:strand:- start:3511 stop:4191 length:681 start_codon:yes stop_codon:yes gene_type:complete
MISYNDLIEASKLHSEKKYKELVEFFVKKIPSKNIIEFVTKLKAEKFIDDKSAVKLNTNKGELLIYKENFLKDLPTYSENNYIIDDYFITIGYPSVEFFSDASFIKKIERNGTVAFITKDNHEDVPLPLLKQCAPYINEYKEKLNNSYVYYINDEYNSRFIYSVNVINYTIYLCMIYAYENLLDEQLFLMQRCSFTYQDFNNISYEQFRKYITLLIKSLKNEQPSR